MPDGRGSWSLSLDATAGWVGLPHNANQVQSAVRRGVQNAERRRPWNTSSVPFKLKTLKAGWGPIGGDFDIGPGDREILNPLFVVLRDKRALIESSWRREPQMPYVIESIKTIRTELTTALTHLSPDSEAAPWVEKLRAACREFLTAVESNHGAELPLEEFQPALAQLRAAFQQVTNHAAAYYRIPAARDLADDMARHRGP